MTFGRIVDFEPATISGIAVRKGHVAVVFPSQKLYESEDEILTQIPLYLCELRVWNGTVATGNLTFPLRVQNVLVQFREGERRCYLPVRFRAAGPVRVSLELPSGDKVVASGDSVTLRVIRKSGEVQVRYEPKPKRTPALQPGARKSGARP